MSSHLISIQVSINSGPEILRLKKILSRDSQVIYKYLGIIKHNFGLLVLKSGSGKFRVDKSELDRLTLTTRDRKEVLYDLKKRFPRIS